MRILSNSPVALAGVLALAPCIPAANGQTFPAGVTPVRGAVTAVTANSVTVQTPREPAFVQRHHGGRPLITHVSPQETNKCASSQTLP